jgi:hypothetical protein
MLHNVYSEILIIISIILLSYSIEKVHYKAISVEKVHYKAISVEKVHYNVNMISEKMLQFSPL